MLYFTFFNFPHYLLLKVPNYLPLPLVPGNKFLNTF